MTLLAVPNISEGRDPALVAHIAGGTQTEPFGEPERTTAPVGLPKRASVLLDISSDADHNRSVLTYGGSPDVLIEALYGMVERAAASLDIRDHDGVHPRFGVVDVLPIVPYSSSDVEAMQIVADLTWRIAQGPGITLYTYGRASEDGRTLPQLRSELRETNEPQHPSAGVICVGIRDPLIAFNVNLDTSLDDAQNIATQIRSDAIRALGFSLPSRGLVQVSMNLIDPLAVGPLVAFDLVAELSTNVVEAEVVGLVPDPVLPEFASLPMARPARGIDEAFDQAGRG